MRQTKIVATISDQRCEIDFIKSLYSAGMNVARLNTAHITTETAKKVVNNIRNVSEKIAIIIDTNRITSYNVCYTKLLRNCR